ncbi:MFS transporter [Siminovitchia sediminis]|uniref:MFS transporter n=1 Tax=Siminovitchia sediminis TaxID=1274353 RepID=A0ABW4KCW3_9BACI
MQKGLLCILILGTFTVGTAELIITGILELISADLHTQESLVGQLITIYALSFALGAPFLARVTARFERKKVLLISLSIFIAGNLLSAVGHSFLMLSIVRSLTALAAALFIVVTLSTAVRLADPKHRGKTLGLVYMGFSAANVFGVPLGTFIGVSFGWRFAFWMIVLGSAACFLFIWAAFPAIKPEPAAENHSIAKLLKNREMIILLSITILLLSAHYIVYGFISPFMTGAGHSLEAVGIILLVAGVSGTLGSAAGGSITDRAGSKKTLAWACIFLIGSMILLKASLPSLFLFGAVVFIWNLVMWATNPAIQAALIHAEPASGDLALSLNMSALNIGIGLGALFGGTVVHSGQLYAAPLITAVITIIALYLLKWVNPHDAEQQVTAKKIDPTM